MTASLCCPGCTQPLQTLTLSGHYARPVELDHCDPCRLVWFDALELSDLSKADWVRLLTRMASADAEGAVASALLPDTGACPRCRQPLRSVHNLTRFGRFSGLACPQCRGELQRDAALLASRGLFRPLLLVERMALAREQRALQCQGCGAALDGEAEHCAYCRTPALVLDLPRLAIAVGLHDEAATDRQRPREEAQAAPLRLWSCHGCGDALDPTQQPSCPRCQHPVLAPRLADLLPMLKAAGKRLRRQAERAPRLALAGLQPELRARVAALTKRPEHQARPRSAIGGMSLLVGLLLFLLLLAWLAGP